MKYNRITKKKVVLRLVAALCILALGYVVFENARLPYGDHVVVAANLADHKFPHTSLISRMFLVTKKEPHCRLTGTVDNALVSIENGTLQFLIASWEREDGGGWPQQVDRKLLKSILDEAISECDPNSFSPTIGPFRPLIYAILLRDEELAQRLLDRGADPMMRIDRPGKKVHGLTAIEFAELIRDKHVKDGDVAVMEKVIALMQKNNRGQTTTTAGSGL